MWRCLLLVVALSVWSVLLQTTGSGAQVHNRNETSCNKEYLFFEFTTAAPIARVKESFEGLIIIYSMKVYGSGRYLYVLQNDQSQALKKLTLPDDACLTVSTFPVERLDTFFGHFDVDFPTPPPFDKLSNQDLTFVELVYQLEGLNKEQVAASLKMPARLWVPVPDDEEVILVAVARLQIKYLFLMNRADCVVAVGLARSSDFFGDVSNINTRVLKLHKI